LPAALLSRFDLIFILLDTYDFDKDTELSRHIGNVHKLGRAPVEDN
jgi:DNA replicative helicase MCM subunit Mcm2 (Cdc46/Mcm family)